MSEIKDGGPAFPSQPHSTDGEPYEPAFGMSLRDYFAAATLTGLAQDCIPDRKIPGGGTESELTAKRAYLLADAMLKARDTQA